MLGVVRATDEMGPVSEVKQRRPIFGVGGHDVPLFTVVESDAMDRCPFFLPRAELVGDVLGHLGHYVDLD